MSGYIENGEILVNEKIGSQVWRMIVYAPLQAKIAKIGQFANLRVSHLFTPLLRRPISYAGFDREKGTVEFLYRVVGIGTDFMTTLGVGQRINTLGPLGTPFQERGNMLLVGGGVGIAPMLCMVRNTTVGKHINVVLGFKNKKERFWADLFASYSATVHITTDDGSLGTKGYPMSVMGDILEHESVDCVYTCGPTPMMKSVAAVAIKQGVSCEVSLEEHMGCGTGGCLGCAVEGRDGRRYKVCTDGPVFPAEEVFF